MTETGALPARTAHNQSMATTLRIWNTRNRIRIERVAEGLRVFDYPAKCRSRDPIRGYAHAHQVMAVHAEHHGCPRYQAAVDYAQEARP